MFDIQANNKNDFKVVVKMNTTFNADINQKPNQGGLIMSGFGNYLLNFDLIYTYKPFKNKPILETSIVKNSDNKLGNL